MKNMVRTCYIFDDADEDETGEEDADEADATG